MAIEPRFEHNGQLWGLHPADAERLLAQGMIVREGSLDDAHPIYGLAPDRLTGDLDDFLIPLDRAATRVAILEGAPPILAGAPHGAGSGTTGH